MLRRHASTIGVERSAEGKAPTAFRIWRAGENVCDDGSVFFTAESAERLMAEQSSKARPYSIDFDHLSLTNDRPADAGRAAGWHRLEARPTEDGPELWAVGVEWCADVRSGLEEEPPRWRFFSPAFFTDDESNEVTSYINLALCINPMTHGIPLLASRKLTKETPMTAEEMLAQLDTLIDATQDPDQKAALVAAREALAAKKDVDDSGDEQPVAESASGEGATTHAEGDDKKDDDDPEKKGAKAHAAKTATDPVAALTAKVLVLERRAELNEIDALLGQHASLPAEFKTHCRTRSLADAKAMISTVVSAGAGVKTHARKTAPSQGSTGGSSELDPRDADLLDRQMGMRSSQVIAPHKLPDGRFVMHNVRPSDLARMNAQKGKA